MKKEIIILSGKAGVGKDTYVQQLKSDGEYKTKIFGTIAYADYLKVLVRRRLGYYNEENKHEYRTLLQNIGDEVRFNNPAFFVNIVVDTIFDVYKNMDVIVITDARYDNEVLAIKEVFAHSHNVKCVKLVREFSSKLTEEQKQHKTEIGISEHLIDEVIFLDNRDSQ